MAKRKAAPEEKPQKDWSAEKTLVTHNGVQVVMMINTPPEQLRDGTWAHSAQVRSQLRLGELDKLAGIQYDGKTFTNASPTSAVEKQYGQFILLISPEKIW